MGPYLFFFFCFPWRSQFPREGDFVRYGPLFSNGPGGIRTLDLFSAIEARSQLRYRPVLHPDFKTQYFTGLARECQAKFRSDLGQIEKSQPDEGWLLANSDWIKRRYW